VRQSSPSIKLITLGSTSTDLMNVSNITWKNTLAGNGVLRAVAFANSSGFNIFGSLDVCYYKAFEVALHSPDKS
jgi:hypothetical protein